MFDDQLLRVFDDNHFLATMWYCNKRTINRMNAKLNAITDSYKNGFMWLDI